MSYASILSVLGWAMCLFAGAMVLPTMVALGYGEANTAGKFFASARVTLFIGGALVIATRGTEKTVSRREGFVLAVLTWGALPVFGALPILFSGAAASAGDAYFEALSALTTTGASVLVGLDDLPRSILFWRAMMQWLGGLGAILLAVAIASLLDIGGLSLYRSAIPHGDRETLAGRLRQAVEQIWWIYACLTAACALALWIAGMPPFDAVSHAFATLSTGGFSTRDGSIGAFGEPIFEVILIVFMVVAALNFTLHWAAAHGRFRVYRYDPEFKYFLVLAVAAIALTTAALAAAAPSMPDAARHGVFTVISVVTTSGFVSLPNAASSAGFAGWPVMLSVLMLILMLVGGCTGSTAGGIKLMRMAILLKQGGGELYRLCYPHAVLRLRYGGVPIDTAALRGAWSFFMVYILSFGTISLAIAASGVEFRTAVGAAAGAISNAGPAMAFVTGQGLGGYGALPDAAKWWVALGMLLGRVELFALLTLLNPAFWRR